MPIIHWAEKEKLLLLEAVNQNKINNRIQWQTVQSIVSTKSYNQCRTMYSVMLKPADSFPVNYNWSFKNYAKLLMCVLEYGTKWEFIQRNYFQETTANALKKKYVKSDKVLQRLINVIKQLNRNIDVQISSQEIHMLQIVIQYIIYRTKLCSWYYQVIMDPSLPKPSYPLFLKQLRNNIEELETEPIDIIEGKLYKRIAKYMNFEQMRTKIMSMTPSIQIESKIEW
ncbi:Myb-like_DNA-binding domain-containing protein [Hexamita inflata]|uniref:Myb-like DNA-binding domain-containing protein n=1 Tax=Hexamita inflata TaxID=28002 RepID=A0AA86VAA5_9EUKA|nr:Myb-like DNA-binding domain-containing protein [Hexamita inflata]